MNPSMPSGSRLAWSLDKKPHSYLMSYDLKSLCSKK